MSSYSRALYEACLSDLAWVLPPSVISSFKDGVMVEDWPEISAQEYAALTLAKTLLKKFQDEVAASADAAALSKFHQVNNSCDAWELRCDNSWDEELLGCFKMQIDRFLNPEGMPLIDHPFELFELGRTGPGAAVGARGYDFYTKLFSSPLSTTSRELYNWYRRYISRFPKWLDAEMHRCNHYGEAYVTDTSKLSFVPKTVAISRTICIEPSLNMFAQLGLGAKLERRLDTFFGINLSTQPNFNRELARLGSLDGSVSTIDLSSASDSMSLKMLKSFLPTWFFRWLEELRTPYTDIGGERVALNMVSTMGNGFTFPLQTMLFACAVLAVYQQLGIKPIRSAGEKPGNFGVFGDDIICVTQASRRVIHLLNLLGFTVNADKSFVEGHFRESCGYDFFRGHNVRGVYIKSLKTMSSRYVAINLLNLWSAKTGIHLVEAVQYLMTTVVRVFVPPTESDDAGIKVSYWFARTGQLRRCKRTGSAMYRCYVPKGKSITFYDDGRIVVPKGQKSRFYNPNGLLLSFLRGDIVGSRLLVRQTRILYARRWKVVPFWDYVPATNPIAELADLSRWESAICHNVANGHW